MIKEETTSPVVQDDQYIEFYENNPNMIHFDPPLTINEFKVLLQASFNYGKTGKMSNAGQL